jgi:hypothetical protein
VISSSLGFFRTFFEALKGLIPSNTTIQYPAYYDVINSVTGNIVSTNGITPPAVTTCSSPDAYPGPAGAQVRWHTSATIASIKPPFGSRIVVGSTFIVPLSRSQFGTDGSLDAAFQVVLQTAASAMVTSFANNLRILSKPVVDSSGTVLRPGQNGPVISATVKDSVAVLRSRRA